MTQFLLYVVLQSLVLCTFGQPSLPGFITTVSQNGLDYAQEVGVNLLEQSISTLNIPDISGSTGTPIGTIDYSLTNIVLDTLVLDNSGASIDAGEGISLVINGISCHIGMDWSYREEGWPHISDSGSADVYASSSSASVTLAITESGGRPVLSVLSCSVDIQNLNIDLHGGASWLYQIFVDIFSGDIQNAVNNALANAITNAIDVGLNAALSTIPIEEPLTNGEIEINFELLSNPIFQSSYFSLPQLGEFYQMPNMPECPSTVCAVNQIPQSLTTQMLQMVISDYVPNTAGFAYYNLGMLKTQITDDMVPPWSPVRLNTSSFEYLLPALYNKFPNMAMQINLYCTQPPNAVFSSSGAEVTAVGNLEVDVIDDGNLENAFTLSGSIMATGTAYLNGLSIVGNLTYLKGDFSLASSNIGSFDVTTFDNLLNLLFEDGVIPSVNKLIATGFVLPTVQGITFNNPSFGWGQDYLYVSTDVTYTPPGL